MSIHHSLLTSSTLQILQIRMIIHKEVLCQHSRTPGLTKNIEPFLPIHNSIRHISPYTTTRKVLDGRLTHAFCLSIRLMPVWDPVHPPRHNRLIFNTLQINRCSRYPEFSGYLEQQYFLTT